MSHNIALEANKKLTREVPELLHADVNYSGSQKYLPTFEPTLHQDFWLCLC